MLKFHQRHGGDGTILVTEVKDPTKYGVIVHKAVLYHTDILYAAHVLMWLRCE